ncbi:flagellar hook protein FlgE [Chitinivorax tropicus]|uniref:Flagellar hook protein FlgE n=1 Tax=Chitinivorax tropicus TaxID=714531 RepID=A0A840MPD1_9PROT|nr:flagellar hook-basal body complex protein [Chitinivorax tropicus]MBB5020300.1 flagellar hook protein FlgE [Chitinivorax tropicus]
MIDTIFIGMSGLSSYSRGLKVISNNVTNLNTPGFKSSQLQFADLFYQGSQQGLGEGRTGHGVGTFGTNLNFKTGDIRSTGNELDLAVDGQGFFVLKDAKDKLIYTKAGQFDFNADGVLVSRNGGERVMALAEGGRLDEIRLDGKRTNPPQASTKLVLSGNLNPSSTTYTMENVGVFDSAGQQHQLKLTFTKEANNTSDPITWTVVATEGSATVASGSFKIKDLKPMAGADTIDLKFTPAGAVPSTAVLTLGPDVRGDVLGATSSLSISQKDGFASGSLIKRTFDADGKLVLTYSNGQTDKPFQLALAEVSDTRELVQEGANQFLIKNQNALSYHIAGNGKDRIIGGSVEVSNVDLSQEFSDLILNQRGYQASSQMVSTANEMIQQLFDMKGHR